MDEFVTRGEHDALRELVDKENDRQNHRIAALEQTVKEIQKLTISVERLAVNMENMLKEQERQSAQLRELEEKPGKRWEAVVTGIIGAVVGAIVTAAMAGII